MRGNDQKEVLSAFLTRPIEHPAHVAAARLVGAGLLAIGVLLVVGAAGATLSSASRAKMDTSSILIYWLVLIPIGAFCCLVGARLALQLRNKYGSLLSPSSWVVLGSIFLLIALWIAGVTLVRGEYLEARAALAGALLAVFCFCFAGYLRARTRRQQT